MKNCILFLILFLIAAIPSHAIQVKRYYTTSAKKSSEMVDILQFATPDDMVGDMVGVVDILQSATPEDIVGVDVDGVLLFDYLLGWRRREPLFIEHARNFYLTSHPPLAPHELEKHVSMHAVMSESRLLLQRYAFTPPEFVDEMHRLVASNVPTFLCTAWNSDEYGHIEKVYEWRERELGEAGYNHPGTQTPIWRLPPLKEGENFSHEGLSAKEYNGIIYTHWKPKGIILKALLKKVKTPPKVIYFIDDDETNLDSIEQELQDIEEELGLPPDTMTLILIHFKWEKAPNTEEDEHVEGLLAYLETGSPPISWSRTPSPAPIAPIFPFEQDAFQPGPCEGVFHISQDYPR